ncbi:MAG: dihydrolipoyl dehydrogenase, partial [Nocardiopsis sp. BM-2018]
LHRGCIPTKALLHSAEVADSAKESENFGVRATFEGIDIEAVHKYKDKVISGLHKGLSGLIKSRKITVVEGEGKLTGKDEVTVDGKVFKGKNILLATGSKPKTLGLEIDGEKVMTSDQAMELGRVPESVIVLGGGVIGVEFASVWRSYGADVTIVEALKHLVPVEEESSSKLLERAFRKRKIKSELGTPFESVKTTDSGVVVTLQGGKTLEAEVLLVAIGRGPVSEGLGYEEQGITLDRGFVQVDENLHTGVGNVYAVGDLIPTLQLAHVGFAEGIFVAEHIAGQNPPAIDYDGVPRVTYCEPEVASVGLTTKVAKERGHDVVEMNYNLAGNGKSQILQTQGAIKVIAEKDGPVLGVHMVGSRVGELIAEGQLIYNWEALPSEVAQLIHPHPSQSEALGEAHLALAGKPLHVHD